MRNVKALVLFSCITILLSLGSCGQSPETQHTTTDMLPPAIRHTTPSSLPPTKSGQQSLPARLIIPAIGVNASIEEVNVTADGDLDVPRKNPWTDTGWYASGPSPGDQGSAVIDGHLDRPGGYPAVFWFLRNLQPGNEVLIENTRGQTFRFRVIDVAFYSPRDAPIQEIFANNSGKYLNLITCAGDWIPSQHQTTLRLVVYTSLE